MEAAIELRGIRKAFGDTAANDGVTLTVRRGEILALLGENGSGKTTLMNMLSGIYRPDSGTILVNGKPVAIASPQDAARLGIGMIHQHFKLIDVLSGADNIQLGVKKQGFWLGKKGVERVKKLCAQYGLNVDVAKKIADMSISEKQTVEILKVLYRGADILILDEPTAVLTPQETDVLFAILRRMKDTGCAIILITHKLNEVLAISDRVTVMRRGKSVVTVDTAGATAALLTEQMVGRPVKLEISRPDAPKTPLLEVRGLTVEGEEGRIALDDIGFALSEGEILGVAGVSGSGQKELCEAIAGLQHVKAGAVLYQNENIVGKTPREIIKRGISMSFIPEDRLGMGLAASMSITDNMLLKSYRDGAGPLLRRAPARAMAESLIQKLSISTPGTETPVRLLSGGNVQKVLLGREIESGPRLLITAYAVRGLDINSSYTIYSLLNEQKQRGVGILFIGEDLDVMMQLCDRILVLCRGKVTGVVDAAGATKEQLGLLMTGAA